MKFKPFDELVLVEVLDRKEEVQKATGLYMPDNARQKFWTVKIVEVGNKVELDIKTGDICIANPVAEVDDRDLLGNQKYRLMTSSNLLGKYYE